MLKEHVKKITMIILLLKKTAKALKTILVFVFGKMF